MDRNASRHDPAQGHRLYIAQAALVEVVASICRKAREQHMPLEERDTTIDDLDEIFRTPTACGWLKTHCILPLVTCVAHTDYEPAMPSSWPVTERYARIY